MKIKIGARIIKTSIAVVLCILIDSLLRNGSGTLAGTAAIIAMQSTFSDSFKKGIHRILGTFFGAFLGYIFALIYPGNLLLIGIGIIILIYSFKLLKWDTGIVISCVVFLVIMTEKSEADMLLYSINRLIDTSIGIIIALFINYFIVPPNLLNNLYKECTNIFQKLSENLHGILYEDKQIDEDLYIKITNLKTKAQINNMEVVLQHEDSKEVHKINEIIDTLLTIYEHLKFVEELKESDDFSIPSEVLEIDETIEKKKLPEMILEFHRQQVIKEYKKLQTLFN